MPKHRSKSKKLFLTLGISLWTATVVFTLLPSWPHLCYRLYPQASGSLAQTLADTTKGTTTIIPTPVWPTTTQDPKENIFTPRSLPDPLSLGDVGGEVGPDFDPTLPEENGLIIDKIGVRGEIYQGSDWENILKQGIWMVPDFGTPISKNQPIILAAHRWGYLSWTPSFRKLNSFYSLPKLTIGDKIIINWEQRQYEYEVTSISTGEKIENYDTDLILYTCQLWNSPTRFFVHATRTN